MPWSSRPARGRRRSSIPRAPGGRSRRCGASTSRSISPSRRSMRSRRRGSRRSWRAGGDVAADLLARHRRRGLVARLDVPARRAGPGGAARRCCVARGARFVPAIATTPRGLGARVCAAAVARRAAAARARTRRRARVRGRRPRRRGGSRWAGVGAAGGRPRAGPRAGDPGGVRPGAVLELGGRGARGGVGLVGRARAVDGLILVSARSATRSAVCSHVDPGHGACTRADEWSIGGAHPAGRVAP